MKQYLSQQNRTSLAISDEHLEMAKQIALTWFDNSEFNWTARYMIEAMIELAFEGHVVPVKGVKKKARVLPLEHC